MSSKIAVPIAVADLAAGQWGLFTTSQARQEGVSAQTVAHLAEQGVLERLRQGVYRIGGTPSSPADQLRSAWLALEPKLSAADRLARETVEVVSHRSAAQLHHLGDLDADRLEFSTPTRRQSRNTDVRFHLDVVEAREWTLIDGLPVTTALRTITDLARSRLDGGHLAGVVRDALTTLHLDPELIIQALRPFAHQYGAPLGDGEGLLAELLQQAGVSEATHTAADLGRPMVALQSAAELRATAAAVRAMQPSPSTLSQLQTLQVSAFRPDSSLENAMRVLRSPDMQAALQALQMPNIQAVLQMLQTMPNTQAALRAGRPVGSAGTRGIAEAVLGRPKREVSLLPAPDQGHDTESRE
jgi:hypothetical protein